VSSRRRSKGSARNSEPTKGEKHTGEKQKHLLRTQQKHNVNTNHTKLHLIGCTTHSHSDIDILLYVYAAKADQNRPRHFHSKTPSHFPATPPHHTTNTTNMFSLIFCIHIAP